MNCSDFYNRVPHFIYAKLTELEAEDLATRVLMEDAISEVTQYEFNIKDLTVTPKHVRLTCNEEYLSGKAGLENISNPFKMVNISAKVNIREIVSVASRQANKKGRKPALINHPNNFQSNVTASPPNITETTLKEKITVETSIKKH